MAIMIGVQSWFSVLVFRSESGQFQPALCRIFSLFLEFSGNSENQAMSLHYASTLILPFFTTIWPPSLANTNRSPVSSLRMFLTRFGTVA
jgi:hypothetical protein